MARLTVILGTTLSQFEYHVSPLTYMNNTCKQTEAVNVNTHFLLKQFPEGEYIHVIILYLDGNLTEWKQQQRTQIIDATKLENHFG